jgi:hypothetical protein
MPFDPTKPVQTSNGLPVKIYTTTAIGERPIHGCYEETKGNWVPFGWLPNGRLHASFATKFDLINIPVKVTRYLNVYRYERLTEPYVLGGELHTEAAQSKEVSQDKHYLATVKIEFDDPAGEPAAPTSTGEIEHQFRQQLVNQARQKAKREALQWALDHFRKQFPVSDAYADYESELIREIEGR